MTALFSKVAGILSLIGVIAFLVLTVEGQIRALVFTNITIIEATGAPPKPGMTVVVRNDRIEAIGQTGQLSVPRGSQVLNGTGKFMIPGLWDMHVHLTDARPNTIPALVANGVTGVRDMGSRLKDLDEWRVKIEAGQLIGPRIFRAGPIVNGKEFGPVHLGVADAAEARATVRALAKVGVDFIKVHLTLNRDQYLAIADESKKVGLPLVGHIPGTVSPEEASDLGQASIEHTETLFQGTFDPKLPREKMLANMTLLFQRFAKNRTFYTPTLIMYKAGADFRDFTLHPESKYVARSANDRWLKAMEPGKKYPDLVAGRKGILSDLILLVGLMQQNGVQVMVGTDLSDGRIFPGFSVHEELALLVEAGFTPAQAIEAATRVPAEFLKLGDTGTIQAGKRADLIVLSADPLRNIRNTSKIEAVVLRGKLLNRRSLDALLAEAEQLAGRN
jgi:imidazolonepropionase-like amidohydrolase